MKTNLAKGYFVPRGRAGPQKARKLSFLKVKEKFLYLILNSRVKTVSETGLHFSKLMEHGPKKNKFRKACHAHFSFRV